MFSRVLVGDDSQSGGRDAVALAERLIDPGKRPELAHVHPPVGSELHRVAQARSVDLLVVGSASHPRAGVALPSDHARAVLNCVPCAVAIAPIGYATDPGQIATIGVADNGSPESKTALAAARELAARDG
jgi:nucleotide-binding universal stress UspA family protein